MPWLVVYFEVEIFLERKPPTHPSTNLSAQPYWFFTLQMGRHTHNNVLRPVNNGVWLETINTFWYILLRSCPLIFISHLIRGINARPRVIVHGDQSPTHPSHSPGGSIHLQPKIQGDQSPANYSHSPGGSIPQIFDWKAEIWWKNHSIPLHPST